MWQVRMRNTFSIMCRSQRPSIFDASHSGTANHFLDHCHGSIMCTEGMLISSFSNCPPVSACSRKSSRMALNKVGNMIEKSSGECMRLGRDVYLDRD